MTNSYPERNSRYDRVRNVTRNYNEHGVTFACIVGDAAGEEVTQNGKEDKPTTARFVAGVGWKQNYPDEDVEAYQQYAI